MLGRCDCFYKLVTLALIINSILNEANRLVYLNDFIKIKNLHRLPQGSIDDIMGMLHMVSDLMLLHLNLYGMDIKVQIWQTKNQIVVDNRKQYDKYQG